VYMCDLRGGQGLWGFAYFPTALEDWAVYDGIVMSNPFTRGDGATYVKAQMRRAAAYLRQYGSSESEPTHHLRPKSCLFVFASS
jgi:hypothetical protein